MMEIKKIVSMRERMENLYNDNEDLYDDDNYADNEIIYFFIKLVFCIIFCIILKVDLKWF